MTGSVEMGLVWVGWANKIVPQLAQNAASGRFFALHFGQIVMFVSSEKFAHSLGFFNRVP